MFYLNVFKKMLDNQAFNILYFQSNCRGPVVKRLRHRPFTAVSWVRIPSGSPFLRG